MRSFAAFLLLITAPCLAFAQQPLVITDSGYYWMDVTTDPPELNKVETVLDFRSDAPDDPEDPDDPSPETVAELAERLARQASDPESIEPLAATYGEMANQVASENMSKEMALRGIKFATDILLENQGTASQWVPFREGLSDRYQTLEEANQFTAPEDVSLVLGSVRDGLLAAKE